MRSSPGQCASIHLFKRAWTNADKCPATRAVPYMKCGQPESWGAHRHIYIHIYKYINIYMNSERKRYYKCVGLSITAYRLVGHPPRGPAPPTHPKALLLPPTLPKGGGSQVGAAARGAAAWDHHCVRPPQGSQVGI